MSYSVVIIDDEPPARAKLQRFIAELADFRVIAEAGTVEEGVDALRTTAADVLFLDIQLGNRSGFEVLEAADACPVGHFHDRLLGIRREGIRAAGARLSAEAV